MPVLSLETIHCYETEDRRYDDCRLDITSDSEPTYSLRRNMYEDGRWEVERAVSFNDSVTLVLWDEDRRRDDRLGTVQINTRSTSGQARFTLDGAHYELDYQVSTDDRNAQEITWDGLRRSGNRGVWPQFGYETIKRQLEARVANPYTINQAQAPLCGPTVAVFELARTNPNRYLQLARELFETGYLPLIGNTIEVPEGLREDATGGGMAEIDWMFAATLRNDANALLRVRSDLLGGVRGATLSGAMQDWSRQLLGMTRVEDVSTETGGELDAIRRAGEVVANGGHAFLQVEARPLLRNGSDRLHYDHWLPLLSEPGIRGNQIAFATYSWGESICVDVDLDTFRDSFHGVIIASRT